MKETICDVMSLSAAASGTMSDRLSLFDILQGNYFDFTVTTLTTVARYKEKSHGYPPQSFLIIVTGSIRLILQTLL